MLKMVGKIVFILLPLVVNAIKFCADGKCGRQEKIAGPGGGITERHSRPFQVALYSRVGSTGELGFCGGSLVHPQWVLTAAHCLFHDSQQVDNVQAILGAHILYDRYENGRRIVNVDSVVVYPDFNPETFANDIALLRLANVMQISETIDTIRLPYLSLVDANFAGQGATASGWGIAAKGVTFIAPTLRQYLMTVITDATCRRNYVFDLTPNTVCGFNSRSGTCKGDNGGPLTVYVNATEETILIGVTSFIDGSGCNTDIPSVFTRVQRYLGWISETTGIALN